LIGGDNSNLDLRHFAKKTFWLGPIYVAYKFVGATFVITIPRYNKNI
jgi:hypothetical protein